MLYYYHNKKKEHCIAILVAYFFIFTVLGDTANALDLKQNKGHIVHFDFGTHPLGISQTTKKFYLCAKESDKIQKDETSTITIVEKIKPSKKRTYQKNIHRWNIPDSRSRINMNRWVKKTKKNQIVIHIDAPYISGNHSNAFKIQEDQCNQNSLLPGTTCQFDILFHPKNEGLKQASIIIPYSFNGINNYYTMIVTGSALKKGKTKMASIIP